MSIQRLVRFSLAGVLLAPAVGAQSQVFQALEAQQTGDCPDNLPFGGFSSDPFTTSICADFTGDGLADLVVQRGDMLEMLFGPSSFAARIGPFATASDVALRPDPGAAGFARLVTVGPAGLLELSWDESAPSFWGAQPIGTSAWQHATHVAVGGSPGAPEVFGVLSDGCTVVRAGPGGEPITLAENAAPVQELEALAFDGVPPSEVAFVSGGRLFVLEDGEVRGDSGPVTYPSHALSGIAGAPLGPQQALWFITGPGGVNEILVSLGPLGPDVQENFQGLPGVVACARGDENGDGDDDLLISHTSLQGLVVFRNSGGPLAPVFDRNVPNSLDLLCYGQRSTPAPTNQAQPAWCDLDNDGDLDVCFPVQATSEIFLHETVTELATDPRPKLAREGLFSKATVHDDDDDGNLSLRVEVVAPPLEDAHRMELILWRRASLQVPTDPLYDPPVLRTWTQEDVHADGVHLTLEAPLADTPDASQPGFDAMYFLHLRWISEGGPGVAPKFPARIYGLQVGRQQNEDYLRALGCKVCTVCNDCTSFVHYEVSGVIGIVGTVTEVIGVPELPPDNPPRPRG